MFFKTHGQVLKKFEVEGLYSLYSIFVLRLQHKLQFFLIKLWFSTRKNNNEDFGNSGNYLGQNQCRTKTSVISLSRCGRPNMEPKF